MKIALDSGEPLENTLRVVGALYNVTLVVADDQDVQARDASQPDTNPEPEQPSPTSEAGNQRAGDGTRSPDSGSPPPADGVATEKSGAARRRRGSRKPSEASVNPAEVRSWARQNGFTVSDRGRIPAPVLGAYRDAHSV